MLDIKIIRDNPEDVKTRLKGKQVDCDKAIDRPTIIGCRRSLRKRRLPEFPRSAPSPQDRGGLAPRGRAK